MIQKQTYLGQSVNQLQQQQNKPCKGQGRQSSQQNQQAMDPSVVYTMFNNIQHSSVQIRQEMQQEIDSKVQSTVQDSLQA